MTIEIDTNLPVDRAMLQLREAIDVAARAPFVQRMKPHLDGEVTAERVVVFRKRGHSRWYGRFEGRFAETRGGARLTGRFVRGSGIFITLWAGFLIGWAILVLIVMVGRWQGTTSAAGIVAALLAASGGVGAIWLRGKNASDEAKLLRQEIESAFGKPGA